MRLRLGERDAEGAFQEARASFYALDRLDETVDTQRLRTDDVVCALTSSAH
jgi:hypothetical protein